MKNNHSPTSIWIDYKQNKIFQDVFAFSTTRYGGISVGNYASLNCNLLNGDIPAHVVENRKRLLASLPVTPQEVVYPIQTHETKVASIDKQFLALSDAEKQQYLQGIDALITQEKGICITVSTADCVPVFLYDSQQKAVSIIHAGWRGMVGKIISSALKEMTLHYGSSPTDIHAIIGPSISLPAFEVGEEVYDAFALAGFPMHRIAQRYNKWHIDLWEAATYLLTEFGVPIEQIERSELCTYTAHQDFFSARRLGVASGRIISGIMLK